MSSGQCLKSESLGSGRDLDITNTFPCLDFDLINQSAPRDLKKCRRIRTQTRIPARVSNTAPIADHVRSRPSNIFPAEVLCVGGNPGSCCCYWLLLILIRLREMDGIADVPHFKISPGHISDITRCAKDTFEASAHQGVIDERIFEEVVSA